MRELAGFTLAVELVGAYLQAHGDDPAVRPAGLLDWLRAGVASQTDKLATERDVAARVRHRENQLGAIVARTTDGLSPAARRALACASHLAADHVPYPWLRALVRDHLPPPPPGTTDAWPGIRRELEGLRLLTPGNHPELGRIHRLVAAHVAAGNTSSEHRTTVVDLVASRCDEIYQQEEAPADWELEALVEGVPALLAGAEARRLAAEAIYLTDKVSTYQSLPAAKRLADSCYQVLAEAAAADASNAGWQRDLSVSLNKVGSVQLAQADLADALACYKRSLAVRERLAAIDASNAGWQRDLFVSCWKLADVVARAGRLDQAREYRRKAQDALVGMKARGIHLSGEDEGLFEQLRVMLGEG